MEPALRPSGLPLFHQGLSQVLKVARELFVHDGDVEEAHDRREHEGELEPRRAGWQFNRIFSDQKTAQILARNSAQSAI